MRDDVLILRRVVRRRCENAGLSDGDTIDAIDIALTAYIDESSAVMHAVNSATRFIERNRNPIRFQQEVRA